MVEAVRQSIEYIESCDSIRKRVRKIYSIFLNDS